MGRDNHNFYQIKRIFLGCPGDLVSERSKLPGIVEIVNQTRAHSLGFHLESVGWERVIPSFGRPQELINRELSTADLVLILLWNRIGSPSSASSTKTGTTEEFELARALFARSGRPLVWVYFRRPTEDSGAQSEAVALFRRSIEQERELFFREYESLDEFEQMIRLHLVAYLDGLRRWGVDEPFKWMQPDRRLMVGSFLTEGVYGYATTMRLFADLDGDGSAEEIEFEYRHGAFALRVKRFDKTIHLALPRDFQDDHEHGHSLRPKTHHVAVKDVTNDGLPEILVAVHDGEMTLRLAVYGFNSSNARSDRALTSTTFSLLQILDGGQRVAYVHEGGTIVLPYGSAGLSWACRWNGATFECLD